MFLVVVVVSSVVIVASTSVSVLTRLRQIELLDYFLFLSFSTTFSLFFSYYVFASPFRFIIYLNSTCRQDLPSEQTNTLFDDGGYEDD